MTSRRESHRGSGNGAYFGGYVNEDYLAAADALELTREEAERIARGGFESALRR